MQCVNVSTTVGGLPQGNFYKFYTYQQRYVISIILFTIKTSACRIGFSMHSFLHLVLIITKCHSNHLLHLLCLLYPRFILLTTHGGWRCLKLERILTCSITNMVNRTFWYIRKAGKLRKSARKCCSRFL